MNRKHFMLGMLGVFLVAALAPLAIGQEVRGRIQGVVADASGAVIPAANVVLTNDNTGVQTTRPTNTGQYVFDYVAAGQYSVRVEAEGFRAFEQKNIRVQTRADITINATLELGAIAETVTVEETPVAVSFNSTTMETTIDTKMTNDLPLVSRNPFMLVQLNPAVNYTGGVENSPYHHWAASQMDVGGIPTTRTNQIYCPGIRVRAAPQSDFGRDGYRYQERPRGTFSQRFPRRWTVTT